MKSPIYSLTTDKDRLTLRKGSAIIFTVPVTKDSLVATRGHLQRLVDAASANTAAVDNDLVIEGSTWRVNGNILRVDEVTFDGKVSAARLLNPTKSGRIPKNPRWTLVFEPEYEVATFDKAIRIHHQ